MIALALIGAAALLAGAAVHIAQLVSIFHAVPWIGPLFAADAIVSTALAVLLLAGRWRRLAAAGGALVSASALAGLALSSTVGLFGWREELLRPSVVIAIGAELVAISVLVPLVMPAPAIRGPRLAAAAGLVAIGGLHIAAAAPEWEDTRGLFWMFMALAATCGALAVRLLFGADRWSWAAVLSLAVLPFVGYVVSRWTGLPGATDDVGDWANPLGIAALLVEIALVPVAFALRGASPIRAPGLVVRGWAHAVDP
jgi:hypothetical protein